jgi:hypothetical protein
VGKGVGATHGVLLVLALRAMFAILPQLRGPHIENNYALIKVHVLKFALIEGSSFLI